MKKDGRHHERKREKNRGGNKEQKRPSELEGEDKLCVTVVYYFVD